MNCEYDTSQGECSSEARELVLRELTALTALRFTDPITYSAAVELGRSYTEPETLQFDSDTGIATDVDSVALRRRNVAGYLAMARFGWCPRCFGVVVTYPDARRLDWPSLDHHGTCRDVAEQTRISFARETTWRRREGGSR